MTGIGDRTLAEQLRGKNRGRECLLMANLGSPGRRERCPLTALKRTLASQRWAPGFSAQGRHLYMPEMKAAMERYEEHLAALFAQS